MSPTLFAPETPALQTLYGRELSPQQATIRDHGVGHQVVVAGAGTGKTEALTQRVLRLLLEGAPVPRGASKPVALEAVLALTFTDKAAAEMRARVYRGLVSRLRAAPAGAERARLETIRSRFFEANRILTFDSFNQKILAAYPDETPLSPGARLLSGADAGRLRRDLTRAFWNRCEEFCGSQKTDLWEFLARFPSRAVALQTIEMFALDNSPADLADLAQLPLEDVWSCEVKNLTCGFEKAYAQKREREAARIKARIEAALGRAPFSELPADVRTALCDATRIREGGARGVVTAAGGWCSGMGKTIPFAFQNDLEREILPLLRAWRGLMVADESGLAPHSLVHEVEYASRRAVALCAGHAIWWQKNRARWLEKNGFADFPDLAAAALRVVQKPRIAETFQKTIAHILIDEFQDTNAAQWELIEAIRSKKSGNVLIVGDEKQAIYGFRGGDITVFDRVRQQLLGDEPPHELTLSRRSTRPLVEFVNALFQEVLPDDVEREPFEAPFQALQAHDQTPGEKGLWRLLARDFFPEADPFEGVNVLRALGIFLRDLHDDATNPQNQARQPDFAPIVALIAAKKPAVGVLFTSHEAKSESEAILRELGVPFTSVKGQGFFQSPPVQLTIHLLAVLLNAQDTAALGSLARSGLGGVSDLALLERALDEEFSRPDDIHAWALLKQRLAFWREMARLEPFSRVLENVLQTSDLAFFEALQNPLDGGTQADANWRKVLDIVREREDGGAGSLRDLHDYFRSLNLETLQEPIAPLPVEGAIQLLTAHGAKGLEFPLVVLAQMGAAPMSRRPNVLASPESPRGYAFQMSDFDAENGTAPVPLLYELFAAQRAAREAAEWRRLFYVACTRAETDLVFVWPAPKSGKQKAGSWAEMSANYIAKLPAIVPCFTPRVSASIPAAPDFVPWEPPLRLGDFARDEVEVDEIFGGKDPLVTASQMRLEWERAGFARASIREEVPFCVRADAVGIEGTNWIFGTFDFLAKRPDGGLEMRVSGSQQRVEILEKIWRQIQTSLPQP